MMGVFIGVIWLEFVKENPDPGNISTFLLLIHKDYDGSRDFLVVTVGRFFNGNLGLDELLSINCRVLKDLNHEQSYSTFNVSIVEFCYYNDHALKSAMIVMLADID